MRTFELNKAHEVDRRLQELAIKYGLSREQLYDLMGDLHDLGVYVNENIKDK